MKANGIENARRWIYTEGVIMKYMSQHGEKNNFNMIDIKEKIVFVETAECICLCIRRGKNLLIIFS